MNSNHDTIVPSVSLVSDAAVQHAKDDLQRIEEELAVGGFIPDPMRPQAVALMRISPQAIRGAIDITEGHGGRLGVIDAEKAKRALAYEEAIGPVVTRLRAVADRLDDSILSIRHDTALQAATVYGASKALDRLPEAQAVRALLKSLGESIAPKRRRSKAVAAEAAPLPAAAAAAPPAAVGGTVTNGIHDGQKQ